MKKTMAVFIDHTPFLAELGVRENKCDALLLKTVSRSAPQVADKYASAEINVLVLPVALNVVIISYCCKGFKTIS